MVMWVPCDGDQEIIPTQRLPTPTAHRTKPHVTCELSCSVEVVNEISSPVGSVSDLPAVRKSPQLQRIHLQVPAEDKYVRCLSQLVTSSDAIAMCAMLSNGTVLEY